ncbi:tetratricopeptide repeat protein [Streptomyces sp. NPDC014685]|uniref:tetratricopeptide repeat protein n=1 Tax=Streptomyces sp. NPDC014685 TaxID=3364881 RepID=UPI0037027E2E
MGAKNNAKGKGEKGGKGGGKARAGKGRISGGVGNDYRGADFQHSQVQGSGTMQMFVQQYAPVPTATDSLPRLRADFTGRDDDIGFLLGVLDPGRTDGLPAHAVLSGWGGVGKTTLVHAAGRAAFERGWFTGVLMVNLRGYDPHPSQAEDALEALLRSLGVRPEHVPPPGAEREALYRSQLAARERAGERLLVIADNASRADQVRPLLPPGHHGLLTTSRRSLPGLGRMRTVPLLQPDDAVALLRAALRHNNPDDRRVDEEPEAAQQVAVACGCLPLALQITAGLLAGDPDQPLAERAERLTRAGRLEGIDDGEQSLRATFDQSFESLPLRQAELFRLLSLNPGPDISTAAVALLAEQPEAAVEKLLGHLAAAHLIERGPVRGRWQMHDLLREYAHEQATAQRERSRPSRRRYDQARTRLIGYYARTAEAADTHLEAGRATVAPLFPGREQALAWLDAERENLIATVRSEGPTQTAIKLGFSLGRYLESRRRLQDLVTIYSLVLDACTARGDTLNEAAAWRNLGFALYEVRRFDEAIDAHRKALVLFQRHADTHHEASAWDTLGAALYEVRRFDEALEAHRKALALFRQHADTLNEAGAWCNLGNSLREVRRFEEAIEAHRKALVLFQRHADTRHEASAWGNLGAALQEVRRFEEAIDAHQKALALYQQHADTHREASSWSNLGLALCGVRRFDEAVEAHRKALVLFQRHADTHREARAWNNLGTALREVRRFDEAIDAGERAAAMLAEEDDWFRTGEAWGELATTLEAAGADPGRVEGAWERSATAYTRAGATEEAESSRGHVNGPPPQQSAEEGPAAST